MLELIIVLLTVIIYFKSKELVRMIIRVYNWHVYMVRYTEIGNLIFVAYLSTAACLYSIYIIYTVNDFYNLIDFMVTDDRVKYFFVLAYLVVITQPHTVKSLLHNAYSLHLYFLNHPRMGRLIYTSYLIIIQMIILILNLYWIGFINHPMRWLLSLIFIVILIGMTYD